MILDYKTINLFDKMLFEKVLLKPPFKKPNPMLNEACFLYVLKGEYESISQKEITKIQKEESLLMKCGNYTSRMLPTQSSDTYQALAVHFYPDVLLKIYENKLPNFLKDKGHPKNQMVKLNTDVLINKYIDGVLFYFDNPELVNEEILVLKLKEIILLLNQTQNGPAIRSVLATLFNPSSYSLREVIEAHYYSNVTLEELAQLNNQSLSTFKREFRKVYNTSPATYLRNKKLEKAENLLLNSDLRATEIAYSCGFTNVAHLSKSFKQKFGISPTQFKMDRSGKTLN